MGRLRQLGSAERTHVALAVTALRQVETGVRQAFADLRARRCANAVAELIKARAALRAAETEAFHARQAYRDEHPDAPAAAIRARTPHATARAKRLVTAAHRRIMPRCVVR